MDAWWSGELSEAYEGLRERKKAGVWGEDVRDRLGWCAWYGYMLSLRRCGSGLLGVDADAGAMPWEICRVCLRGLL